MEKVCPICGKTNKINNKFCITCGVKLGEAEPNQKQIIMPEKDKLEKWERNKWYIFPSDYKIRFSVAGKLAYGNITVDDEQISIGDFSIKYLNIVRAEKDKNIYLIIYCVNGRNYRLVLKSDFNSGSRSQVKARDKLFSVLTEKLKQFEEIKINHAEKYIKNLPNLYKEISLDDLTSRIGLERSSLMNLLESLVLNGEIEAEISGNILKFRKEQTIITSPKGYTSEPTTYQEPEKREGMLIKAKKTLDLGHDVFICHSSKDKEIADATCHFLEQNGIKCWIAPRDVSTGSYAVSIVDAIETSKLLVIIFSNNSNVSDHVKNELEIAVSSGITIQPFRIEDVEPSTEMKYYIERMHWLDALTPPLEDHLSKLTEMISKLLEVVSN